VVHLSPVPLMPTSVRQKPVYQEPEYAHLVQLRPVPLMPTSARQKPVYQEPEYAHLVQLRPVPLMPTSARQKPVYQEPEYAHLVQLRPVPLMPTSARQKPASRQLANAGQSAQYPALQLVCLTSAATRRMVCAKLIRTLILHVVVKKSAVHPDSGAPMSAGRLE